MIRRHANGKGFSLVEVTLALGVAAFCLLSVCGLLTVGLDAKRGASSQTAAAGVLAAVVDDLRATPKSSATSSQFAVTFGNNKTLYFDALGRAATTTTPASPSPFQARYQVNVTFPASGDSTATFANVRLTWPADADPATAAGSAELFAAFDRN